MDVGTSTCKGVVFSAEGRILAQKQIAFSDKVRISGPKAEIPAEIFWKYTAQMIRELAKAVYEDPIEALAVSSHGETLIPVDGHGKALCPAMLSMDRQSRECSEELIQRLGEKKIYGLTGSMMHSQFPVPKIMWLKKVHPEITANTDTYHSANDYIYHKLGFPGVVDYSIASRFGGLDIRKRDWAEELLEAAGIEKSRFPSPVCAGTVLGEIPQEIAGQLGLGDKVLAVMGGHDQPCAAIGMGKVDAGTVTVSAGSYECISISTKDPLNDGNGMRYGLNSYCHVLPNQYITLAFFVSGMMTKWFLDTFCQEEKRMAKEKQISGFAMLDSMYGEEPTGICVTPHIYGSMNPEWSEGTAAKITGLTAAAAKADLYKAVLEGTCCELDLNLQVLEHLWQPIQKLLYTGGGTKSEKWMQLRADITGKLTVAAESDAEASCVGAALLAGIGAGVFADLDDANAKIRRNTKVYQPKSSNRYEKQKADYLTLHRPGLLKELQK